MNILTLRFELVVPAYGWARTEEIKEFNPT